MFISFHCPSRDKTWIGLSPTHRPGRCVRTPACFGFGSHLHTSTRGAAFILDGLSCSWTRGIVSTHDPIPPAHFERILVFITPCASVACGGISSYQSPSHSHRPRRAPPPSLGVGDDIGEGDSGLVLGILPPDLADVAFEKMRQEVAWNVMYHRGAFGA